MKATISKQAVKKLKKTNPGLLKFMQGFCKEFNGKKVEQMLNKHLK